MNIEQIITLLNAGYTKEEIQQLEQGPVRDIPDPEPAAEPEPDPVQPDPEPKTGSGGADLASAFDKAIERLNTVVDERLKEIQAANVKAARLPEDKPRTAEDAIASVLKSDNERMGRRKRED